MKAAHNFLFLSAAEWWHHLIPFRELEFVSAASAGIIFCSATVNAYKHAPLFLLLL